jgi:hypothetical protein
MSQRKQSRGWYRAGCECSTLRREDVEDYEYPTVSAAYQDYKDMQAYQEENGVLAYEMLDRFAAIDLDVFTVMDKGFLR